MLDKAKADEKDPYIDLLDYRNTLINDVSSPAQLLMNRRLRGKQPAIQKQFTPKAPNIRTTRLKMKSNKIKQKNYYDVHAKKQQKLSKGQTVRYQHNNRWKQAIITKQHDQPPSHTVQPYTTRSGRTIRPQVRYKDYVK